MFASDATPLSRFAGKQSLPRVETKSEFRAVTLPVTPNTIAKSLAIGSPADGYYASGVITDSGGWADDVPAEEIRQGIRLLAETEGIFTETAGGVTVAVTKKLREHGRIRPDDLTVIAITGNGLKTQDALALEPPTTIDAKLNEFDSAVNELSLTA